jgi:hypothetical protein
MNILEETFDNRAQVNYHELLSAITKTVEKQLDNLFSISQTQITFDVDKIAFHIASHYPANKLLFEPRRENVFVSTHFADLDAKLAFTNDVLQLQAQLRERFLRAFPEELRTPNLSDYIRKLFTRIDQFAQDSQTPSLKYASLSKAFPLRKQRLHLRALKTDMEPCLKGHKLTIQVERLRDFSEQITQGLLAFLRTQEECTEDDIIGVQKELERQKQKPTSDLNRLSEAMVRHSLARLQRAAQLHYLHYLYNGIQEWHAPAQKGPLPLLHVLFNRLQKLEAYFGDPLKEDSYYQVSYQNASFNLRELFTRADAFDMLPIITIVEGLLGEHSEYEKAQKTFTFGLKLKLNGPVQAHGGQGESVFDYYLALLNPNSALYKQREQETATDARERQRFLEKGLRVAVLYSFVFSRMNDEQFDPIPAADRLLQILHENDDQQKTAMFAQLHQDIRISKTQYLDPLRKMLVAFLHNQKIGLPKHEEPLTLSLHHEILAPDLDSIVTRHHFFQEGWERNDGKDVLRYVSVEGDSAGSEALCRFPVTLIFETTYYDLDQRPPEAFTMSYSTTNLLVLPVAMTPFQNEMPDSRQRSFLPDKNVMLSYRQQDAALGSNASKLFAYRFTYTLLAYLFLKLILDESVPHEQRRRVFLPIVCFHTKPEAVDANQLDTEAFLHNFSKVLAHMLAEDYQASSQGLDLRTTVQGDRFKLPNALASLYNALPRSFSSQAVRISNPSLDKLAIIAVSSRRADLNQSSPHAYSSTIYGDVIGMERRTDGSIRASILTTFSETAEAAPMYEHPEAIIEQVRACYQQGYRHFLYVAQAPYTSTLHLPSSDARTELYFMNESVIKAMRQVGEGTKVYPIFCDKYYVVRQRRSTDQKGTQAQEPDSLYIDDLGELSKLAADKSKRTLIFFNVFNGLTVSKKDDIDQRIYNGVVSYGTLVNMYEDTTYYQYIWQDLLGERAPNSFSTTLLDFLTLLHFMRYEKNKPDRFKLDPYSRIIGNDSIGKCAIFPHMFAGTRFNSLAFLTLVRSVLQTKR